MIPRLQAVVARAEASLPEAAQDDLADLIDGFMARRGTGDAFMLDELAEIDRLAAGSFADADLAEVAALMGRRGTWSV